MEKIAIIGCGLIGGAWAITFARAGHDVALWDAGEGVAAGAHAAIPAVLSDMAESGILDRAVDQILSHLRVADTLEDALDGVAYVQESTPEKLDIKREVFARLDAAAHPDTILASSTSALLPSAFTEALTGRTRCLVAHPINPPSLVPAVEMVPAPWTDAATLRAASDLMERIGQKPIRMNKELDGFVVNRLQGALLHEAFRLVADGYAAPEDVDVAIRDGLALRWSFMGPFETIDLNAPGGVRDYVERYGPMYAQMGETQHRNADWFSETLDRIEEDRRARLPKDDLGKRHAWRDRRLMALIGHKRDLDKEFGK